MSSEPQAQQRTPDAITQTLLTVVQQLASELHPHKHNALTEDLHDIQIDVDGEPIEHAF